MSTLLRIIGSFVRRLLPLEVFKPLTRDEQQRPAYAAAFILGSMSSRSSKSSLRAEVAHAIIACTVGQDQLVSLKLLTAAVTEYRWSEA